MCKRKRETRGSKEMAWLLWIYSFCSNVYRLRQDACLTPIHHSAINIQLNSDEMMVDMITAHINIHKYSTHHTHAFFSSYKLITALQRDWLHTLDIRIYIYKHAYDISLEWSVSSKIWLLYRGDMWYCSFWHNGKNGGCSMVKRAKLGKQLE